MSQPADLPLTRRELKDRLAKMKIPRMRRDISRLDNLLWLSRNIGIANRDHPDLQSARLEIRALIKNERLKHEV